MDAAYPIALAAGIVIGAVAVWRWRRRPLEVDVTIRHKENNHDPDR